MIHTYLCKKTGRSYLIDSTKLPNVSNEYAWHKGVNEYMDNYHAELTLKGKNPFTGTDTEFKTKVAQYCDEAMARLAAGDVRGSAAIDFEAGYAASLGITVEELRSRTAAAMAATKAPTKKVA